MRADPIAIVGIGCRFPKEIASPTSLWGLLTRGESAISDLPSDRAALWGTMASGPRFGGFLADIWAFDPGFFGISPREAEVMDPQHRLLLQTTWEALEDAGIRPSSLAAEETGVFLGLFASDYAAWTASGEMLGYLGSSRNAAAGRIAYALDLHGPASVIDTDRSSGLVALHEACGALSTGECTTAIVGAANVVLDPRTTHAFASAGMLAPDGKCKFADARADGFVRSDGVATLILRPLRCAIAEGCPIYAVIRGSAIMTGGKSALDLMGQSARAQERLIRKALVRAGVEPREVTYVEAHGTGTPLGDRTELTALDRIFRTPGRPPCWIGSVKTNLGHTEPCAGLAGVIKVALAARRRMLPPSLHFERFPDGLFEGEEPGLRVVRDAVPLDPDVPFIAGVSAFGLTGINAHAVLEAPPVAAPNDALRSVRGASLLCLSSRREDGLRRAAARYAEHLRTTAASVEDTCHSALAHRERFEHRAAFVVRTREQAIADLEAFATRNAADGGFAIGRAQWKEGDTLAFVFPGQGSQWAGMGRGLLAEQPVFAAKMAECDAVVQRLAGWSLLEELRSASRLDAIDVVQPLLVAMEISLAAMWMDWGIVPSVVIGTSMGEAAAACVAGALSLEDALRVIVARTRLMRTLRGGAMAVVELPAAEIAAELDPRTVSIAAINSPLSTVIAGERAAVEAVVSSFQARNVFARLVRVDVASHSPRMDPILEALRGELRGIVPRPTAVSFFSTVRGRLVDGTELDASYWVDNLRLPVAFAPGVRALADRGATIFVEVSPHPVLRAPMLDGFVGEPRERLVLPTLLRDEDELRTALGSLGKMHAFGFPIEWERVQAAGRFVPLPTYAWANDRYVVASRGEGVRPDTPTRAATSTSEERARAAGTLADRIQDAPRALRVRLLSEELTRELARILKLSVAEIDPSRPLRDHGLGSAAATELRSIVGAWFGRALPSSLLFNHPTIRALAEHLAGEPSANPSEERPPARHAALPGADDLSQSPIAIVGMSLRFPGSASSPEAFWRLLVGGESAITEIPPDRWDAARFFDKDVRVKGKMHTRWGGFVSDIARFDADFFGIAPIEATSMDPQQRLLLELSWNALESAGMSRSEIAGTSTGVFVGIMNNNEYARRKGVERRPELVLAHTSTGDATSIAAGRLSYFFGLHGPAVSVDTACSSSLVALHLAIQSLRTGECEAAIVGGVNLIAHPTTTLAFAKTRLLSPTGSCKTFDASADGYVRGEGGCVLVVKRLADAQRANDPILAVIRGSATNQDGRGSGLTAPNGNAQRALIRRALADARVDGAEVAYVEAHGTGTVLGDPIEIHALVDVFGTSRSSPLVVGAAKANVGHLEACAGLVGVAKVVLALHHETIPRQIHFENINPKLEAPDWLVIPRENRPWVRNRGRRLAGVSSFGFSGTNAHVIIEEAPEVTVVDHAPRAPVVMCLSADTPAALRRRAASFLASELSKLADSELSNLAASVARADPLPIRAAFVCSTTAALRAELQALADGESKACALLERATPLVLGFVYPNASVPPPSVGRALYASEPTFRGAVDACTRLVEPSLRAPLAAFFQDGVNAAPNARSMLVASFALQLGLTALWRDWGVVPESVLGDGTGEYAAAHAAGILELEEALALLLDGSRTTELGLRRAPVATFVSTRAEGHAPDVVPAALPPQPSREPSQVGDALRRLLASGTNLLVEIGPDDRMLRRAREDDAHVPGLASLDRDVPLLRLAKTVADLYVAGANVALRRYYAGRAGRYIPLPPYPFAGRHYWIDDDVSASSAASLGERAGALPSPNA